MTLSLRRVSLAASLYFLFCALVCGAQNINVDQIRTGTTNNGNVVTTVNGTSVWAPASGGIPNAQGTAPITVNGLSGTPESGPLTIACPSCGANVFQAQVIPPVAGQNVILFPTANVPTNGGPQSFVSASTNTSAQLMNLACGGGGGQPGCGTNNNSTVVWSGFALPPGVSASNVTAIYAFAQVSNSAQGGSGGQVSTALSCTGFGGSSDLISSQLSSINFPAQPLNALLSGAAGSSIPSITCTATIGNDNSVIANGLTMDVNTIALVVYYTGSPVTQPSVINIASPISYNPSLGILGLSSPYNYSPATDTSDAYAVNGLPFTGPFVATGTRVLFTAPNFGNNTTTTPSLNVNGFGPITIVKVPGHTAMAPNDIQADCTSGTFNPCVADVIYDGSFWVLQNPATGYSGSGGTSISVNGTSVSNPNFNGTTPAAPSGAVNVAYQVSGSSVSGNVPVATGSTPGVVKPDGTTCTVASGVLTCPGNSGATSIAICADTSGSGTAQSCTTSPSFTPVAGSVIAYTTTTPNAGTALTENVNGLGAKPVAKWQTNTTLAAGDVAAGAYILETYNGTNWELATIGNAPSSGGSSNSVYVLPNGTDGTSLNLLACWQGGNGGVTISTCPAVANNEAGTDNPQFYVGVVIAGAGTTGDATAAWDGPVQWICDNQVNVGIYVLASTTPGECTPGNNGTDFSNPSDPQSVHILGRVIAANSGPGTAATVEMAPFFTFATADSNLPLLGSYVMLSDGNGSSFMTQSHIQQLPSNFTVPYSLALNGIAVQNLTDGGGFSIIGDEGGGIGQNDVAFDPLAHGHLAYWEWVGPEYHLPNIQTASGSVSVGAGGQFQAFKASGLFIWTLAANSTTFVPNSDNPGHIMYFDIVQAASGGPFTWTWPSNFINAPTVSTVAGSSTLASFMFDGTNYNCLSGCASSGGDSGVPSVNGITSAVTVAGGTGIEVSTAGSTITITNTGGSSLAPPFNYAAAGGAADSYTLTLSAFSSSTLATGTEVLFTPPNFGTNTTSTPTLNLNGLGAITIVKDPGESGLAPGDIVAQGAGCGGPCISDLIYNGSNWVLQNPQTPGQAAGSVTLSSGTATISLPPGVPSCRPSTSPTCVYQLTNCGPNSSTSLGILAVTNFPSGGAFTISSLTSTNTVNTADVSTVCWRIN